MNGKGSFRINGMGQLTYHAFLFTWFYSGEHSRWKKIVYWDMNAMWKPPVDSDDFIWFAGKVLIGVTACAKSKDFIVQGNWLNNFNELRIQKFSWFWTGFKIHLNQNQNQIFSWP